jgi:hypothetical protein
MKKEELLKQIGELIDRFEEENDNNPVGVYIDFLGLQGTPESTIYEWNGRDWKVSSGVEIKFVTPDPLAINF